MTAPRRCPHTRGQGPHPTPTCARGPVPWLQASRLVSPIYLFFMLHVARNHSLQVTHILPISWSIPGLCLGCGMCHFARWLQSLSPRCVGCCRRCPRVHATAGTSTSKGLRTSLCLCRVRWWTSRAGPSPVRPRRCGIVWCGMVWYGMVWWSHGAGRLS